MLYTALWRATTALKLLAEYWLPWSEWTTSMAAGWRTTRARHRGSLTKSSGMDAHVPHHLAQVAVEPGDEVESAATLLGQVGDVA
jgi:hypothetical protein